MPHVATLVAKNPFSDGLVASAADVLAELAGPPSRVWLAAGRACDLTFDAGELGPDDLPALERALRETVAGHPVDVAVQPLDGRRKKLLVADLESTVIRNEMLDELADFAGVRPRVEDITARAMRGEIDFEGALRERVGLLRGLPATVLDEAALRIELDPGARPLVRTLRRHGVRTALVSGGFGVFAGPVAADLGFDRWYANEILVDGGRLSGGVGTPILDRVAKVDLLNRLCAELDLGAGDAAAVGDGANDLPMLLAAGLGVAYRGKPAVAGQAAFRVDHGDLTTLLYFMGYRQGDLDSGEGRPWARSTPTATSRP